MAKNHLYLVDGSGYIFRAYHRLPPLTDPHGTPVGAVYGFTAMLWKLIEELNKAEAPTHLLVVFDAGATTFRNAMYDGYKAQRPPPPEDLVPQFPLIRDAVRAFSIKCLEQDGYEADDIIASYSLAALKQGFDVTIVSSDKDLMQLVQPGLDMYDTMKNCRINREEVVEKFGVGPEQVGEVLALMGDSVDNVPGVRGIGPKGAADLIREFGTVDALLGRLDEIKRPKLREMLETHADNARLSRELVRLKDDLPLELPLETLTLQEPPKEPLAAFLAHHGFRALLSKLGRETEAAHAQPVSDAPAIPFNHADYECVTTLDRLDWWIEQATTQGLVAVDSETDNLDATRACLVGLSLAIAPGVACYVPLDHKSGEGLLAEKVDQLDAATVIERLNPLFANPAVLKVGQNLKYDMIVFERHGAHPIAPFEDTMVMSYNLDGGRWNGHGMDDLSTRHLGHTPISYKEVTGTHKARVTFDFVELRKATDYAAEDADVTLRLYLKFKERLWREQATRIYRTVDQPLIPVVAGMERAGILVDRGQLSTMSAAFEGEIATLEATIHEMAGHKFTIGSPKQLGEVLFDKLGHASGKKSGKTGAYATDVTELERLAASGVDIAARRGALVAGLEISPVRVQQDSGRRQLGQADTGGQIEASVQPLHAMVGGIEVGRDAGACAAPIQAQGGQLRLLLLIPDARLTPAIHAVEADAELLVRAQAPPHIQMGAVQRLGGIACGQAGQRLIPRTLGHQVDGARHRATRWHAIEQGRRPFQDLDAFEHLGVGAIKGATP